MFHLRYHTVFEEDEQYASGWSSTGFRQIIISRINVWLIQCIPLMGLDGVWGTAPVSCVFTARRRQGIRPSCSPSSQTNNSATSARRGIREGDLLLTPPAPESVFKPATVQPIPSDAQPAGSFDRPRRIAYFYSSMRLR